MATLNSASIGFSLIGPINQPTAVRATGSQTVRSRNKWPTSWWSLIFWLLWKSAFTLSAGSKNTFHNKKHVQCVRHRWRDDLSVHIYVYFFYLYIFHFSASIFTPENKLIHHILRNKYIKDVSGHLLPVWGKKLGLCPAQAKLLVSNYLLNKLIISSHW